MVHQWSRRKELKRSFLVAVALCRERAPESKPKWMSGYPEYISRALARARTRAAQKNERRVEKEESPAVAAGSASFWPSGANCWPPYHLRRYHGAVPHVVPLQPRAGPFHGPFPSPLQPWTVYRTPTIRNLESCDLRLSRAHPRASERLIPRDYSVIFRLKSASD